MNIFYITKQPCIIALENSNLKKHFLKETIRPVNENYHEILREQQACEQDQRCQLYAHEKTCCIFQLSANLRIKYVK